MSRPRIAAAAAGIAALFAISSPAQVPITGAGIGAPGSAFYVATAASSPAGNDSNPGTLAAPFLTLTKCKTAMRASSTTKTCYVRAGTFTPGLDGAAGDCYADTSSYGAVLVLTTPSDDGETWSYYPPDGYNNAIINGQATSTTGPGFGFCSAANTLTVNGLYLENFRTSAIQTSGTYALIENNEVNGIVDSHAANERVGIKADNSANGQIVHNIVINSKAMGIGSFPSTNGGADNLLIAYNYLYNNCTTSSDCGGIYLENSPGGSPPVNTSTNEVVEYNYVTTVNAGGGGRSIYLDDNTSGVTVNGNVALGVGSADACYFVHGGSTNIITGNICDISTNTMGSFYTQQYNVPTLTISSGTYTTGTGVVVLTMSGSISPLTTGQAIYVSGLTGTGAFAMLENTGFATFTTIATTSGTTITYNAGTGHGAATITGGSVNPAPTGNTYSNNINVGNIAAPGGNGYQCYTSPCAVTNGPNGYYDYAASATLYTGGDGFIQGDSNPQTGNPSFTGTARLYILSGASTFLSAPVSFPAQPANWGAAGFWGPPGFTPPAQGVAPSP